MALLLEAILTLALIVAAIKLGWLWTILFMLLYITAFSSKWTFLSRRSVITSRFLAFLAFFLTLGLVMRKVVDLILSTPEVQGLIAGSGVLRFLVGTDPLKVFWSLVIGLGVTVIMISFPLLVYGYIAGQNIYSQHEQYKGHEWDATQSAISVFLGVNRGTWIVSDGKAEVRGESGSSLTRFGGPGILIVQEGHAVILEVSGKISRVVGRGITWLKPFERISMVVPLFLRSEKVSVEQVATKDKILIPEFEVQVYHKADSGPEEDRIQDGLFAYTEDKVLKEIWGPSGNDWRGAVRSVADTATRDVVGRFNLEQIVPISDTSRATFRKLLTDQINKVTKDKMGIETVTVDIGKIRIPEEAEKRLMSKWSADWDLRIAQSEREAIIRRGEAEAVLLKVKEVAWAQAQKQVIEEITAGFQSVGIRDGIQAPYIIALRSLETLEKMAADPATKILLPYDVLHQIKDLRQVVQESTNLLAS